jgi:hypothetical protein
MRNPGNQIIRGDLLTANIMLTLKAQILKKLRRRGNWGASHAAFDDLPKSTPNHLRGKAKDAAEELISEGLLIPKQTCCGRHVSLNPQRKADIGNLIQVVLDE